MFRIDHPTAAIAMPPPGAAGTGGFFTSGDPVSGVPATVVTADFMNIVQEEMVSVLEAAGIAPDKADNEQLLAAINIIVAAAVVPRVPVQKMVVFNSSGSWVSPFTGIVEAELNGGGGGGGYGGGGYTGTGGGAGGYCRFLFAVTQGVSYSYVIGDGGNPGASPSVAGTAGGNTTMFGGAGNGGRPGNGGTLSGESGQGGSATIPSGAAGFELVGQAGDSTISGGETVNGGEGKIAGSGGKGGRAYGAESQTGGIAGRIVLRWSE